MTSRSRRRAIRACYVGSRRANHDSVTKVKARGAASCSAPLAYRAIAYGVAANASSVIDAELLRHQQRYPTADRCIDGDAIEVTIKITSCTSDAWEKR